MEKEKIEDSDVILALQYIKSIEYDYIRQEYKDYKIILQDSIYNYYVHNVIDINIKAKLDHNIDYTAKKKFLNTVSSDVLERCERLLHNRYKRKSRIYKCIDYMLNNYPVCYFCTMTLNEDSIKLTMKYLKKMLTIFLGACHTCYLGNVDFGDTTGRLHFHVIIAENDVHICKDNLKWPYGFYDIKVINDKNSLKLGSYIMKLVNHATKETTKDRIITPRGEFSFAKLLKK